ncbi:aspartate--ammonia ligase [Levilactobacillus tujiorum]|uniref:Aspartate--ammonia ligase n=1 Tax=Levilactobacillus tujiorum TaxID=2912243 RepID=A0ABX1L393_9LACO|nr:aspartate--ammonia ligase [Levilactobacillus tujiorum]MCH5463831.1 aspartate--ammonia ligase [Levilactobacillus tujiorum]NLR11038.1 aspartate--ammonia ligase [Lactobacillus sp. HBUAS51387]NLR28764.1 aspartate--ammonia ligase [Levilactobacillus tujiorum]
MHLIIPKSYDPKLSIKDTQEAIRFIRETFQEEFGKQLNLSRLTAPMFVEKSTGLNDNLNGTEKPVSFTMADMGDSTIEIVHSLAKWKRVALKKNGFKMHEGLYTNMNAIRKDEDLDNFHSAYVDQWDWEKIIAKDERTEETLKATVRTIFKVIKHMEHEVWYKFPQAVHHLPDEIHFITTQELEDMYPEMTPRERENAISKKLGCVFLMKIGGALKSGKRHDGRAPDYDDWELNGDIMFWYEPLQQAIEISSMGVRVDAASMQKQLKIAHAEDRLSLPYHQMIMNGELPFTIGGGIGQSRLCMLLLGKAHVGEVQTSIWPQAMIDQCEAANIHLL